MSIIQTFLRDVLDMAHWNLPVDNEGIERTLRDAVASGRLVPVINREWCSLGRVSRPDPAPPPWFTSGPYDPATQQARKPKSIVVDYDPGGRELTFQTVEDARIKPLLTGTVYPILIDEFGGKIDDEFARRFGAAILNCLALFKPELKELMPVTEQPVVLPDKARPASPKE